MKKKIIVPIFLAAMALPLALNQKPIGLSADFIGEFLDKNTYLQYGISVNAQMADEGFVLLKNDGTLPLGEGARLSVVGRSSVDIARGGGGSGSGSVSSGVPSMTIKSSLEDVGFELNPVTDNFYSKKAGSGRTNGNDGWKGNSEVTIGETAIEKLTADDEFMASLDEYNDAAIQVLTREGSEGCDVKTCNAHDSQKTNSSAKAISDKHALELSDNEQALFDMLHDHFEHIIIVINSSNIFECDKFQKDPKVAGVIWVGNPGDVGIGALGRILVGDVNPSGRTVDTWARDFTKDPTFQNFSDNSQTNKVEIDGVEYYAPADTMFNADGTPTRSYGTDKSYTDLNSPRWDNARGGEEAQVVSGGINGVKPSAYVAYEEGIYVDYRYYETKYADMAKEDQETADEWYNGEEGVVYPFGYGLSYTTFDQKILRVNPAKGATLDDKTDVIEVSVKVTNTGAVAGKDAVQIYWKAPYTAGGIEKADHVLCAFDKSDILEPGESQIMQLTFHLQDVANYDFSDANKNGFCGYELDDGEYAVMLAKNAHEFYGQVKLNVVNGGIKYETDRFTGHEVVNRFTDRGFYSSMPSNDDMEFEQMSRADFEGTFPHHPTIESRTLGANSRVEEFLTHEFSVAELDEGNFEYVPEAAHKTEADFVAGGWQQNNDYAIKLDAMKDVDWDDPKWEQFLNGFKWSDMLKFTESNGMSSPSLSEVGKSGFSEGDGPQKLKNANMIYWVSSPIIAATFNPNLAHKQGECVGMESNLSNASGWWGPAVNTHRSPFGGRNFEYYSADPFLMGRIAANVVGAATDRGLFCYFKHFAVNDQEKNRESGISFLTEQALREIYLKSFQMVFEEGKSIGVMGSYNRLGLMETAASYPLMTEVLRGEWGFKGAVLSDMTHSGNGSINFKCYENVNNRVLAGCNSQLDQGGFGGKSEAKWDSTAWGGKGAPTYTNKNGEKVISWSYWYATRQMIKGVMYMSVHCTGQYRGLTQVVKEDSPEIEVGKDFTYEVKVDGSTLSNFRINDRIELPKGVTFNNGVLSGQFANTGLYRIDVIANNGTKDVAIKLLIYVVPNEAEYSEDIMEPIVYGHKSKDNDGGKKKGCFGDIASTGALIGLISVAGVGFMLLAIDKKRRAR